MMPQEAARSGDAPVCGGGPMPPTKLTTGVPCPPPHLFYSPQGHQGMEVSLSWPTGRFTPTLHKQRAKEAVSCGC